MKKFLNFFIFVAILASLSMGAKQGCTTTEKVAGGTAGGAALGAIIGAFTGSPGAGAAIGAGAGALGGALFAAATLPDDDIEKLKKLSGSYMKVEELDNKLLMVGVSSDSKNAIMNEARAISEQYPNARFGFSSGGDFRHIILSS